MRPDFNALFGSSQLDEVDEKKLRKALTDLGFNSDTLAVTSMDTEKERWCHYEIIMPHKSYQLPLLINIQRTISSVLKRELSMTFKAKKIGTYICFEFT